ncbi:MAG: hypothetical protein WC565_05630 [Parcubacteria group bacterium]
MSEKLTCQRTRRLGVHILNDGEIIATMKGYTASVDAGGYEEWTLDEKPERFLALFLAAPEQQAKIDALLAALKDALEVIGEHEPDWPPNREDSPIVAQLKAAIVLAEGKE